MASMTKAELLEAAQTLFKELVKGDDADDIADIMGWDQPAYSKILKTMLDVKVEENKSLTPEQTYVNYIIDQRKNIHELDKLIGHLDTRRNHNAVIGAIRLRSDITDKVLERGFDFGVVQRKQAPSASALGSGNTFVINGVDIRVLSAPQLQDAIKTQLTELSELVSSSGDSKSILDLPVGDIHYGDCVKEAPEEAPHEIETSAVVVEAEKPKKKKRSID